MAKLPTNDVNPGSPFIFSFFSGFKISSGILSVDFVVISGKRKNSLIYKYKGCYFTLKKLFILTIFYFLNICLVPGFGHL